MSDTNQYYNMTPEFFSQVSESIKSVFDITSRIDERVKIIMEKQTDFDRKIVQMMDSINSINSRVTILEAKDEKTIKESLEKVVYKTHELEKKLEIMQLKTEGSEGKWRQIMGFVAQVSVAIITAYIAYKLGINQNNP